MLPVLSLNGLGTVLKNLEPVAGALFGLSSSVFSAFFFHMLIASLGSPGTQNFKILNHQVEIITKLFILPVLVPNLFGVPPDAL